MEQAVEVSQPQKQFAEDNVEESAPKKSGGFFSNIFGGLLGSKAEPKKSTTEVARNINSSANSYIP